MSSSSPRTAPASAIGDARITAFGFLVEAHRRLERMFDHSLREHHGLSIVWFEALLRLGRSPQQTLSMSELAGQMVLSSGGATRLVDRLVEEGYVERVACPDDRRVQWVRLTASGAGTLEAAARTHLADLDEHYFAAFEPGELAAVTAALERLRGVGEAGSQPRA